jgi:mono/diheme cytochrome c family protein
MPSFAKWLAAGSLLAALAAAHLFRGGWIAQAAEPAAANAQAHRGVPANILSVFRQHCFDCHAEGNEEGGLALDNLLKEHSDAADHEHWLAVWQNLRAQTMPPSGEAQPSDSDRASAIKWIEHAVFQLDPAHPDPGRVTIRRLNREEYANTIFDLLGVEFDTGEAFPADDTGYGFDTIGDVLTLSPMLLEKYLEAAEAIVARAVPPDGPRIPIRTIAADKFRAGGKSKSTAKWLAFAKAVTVQRAERIEYAGRYRFRLDIRLLGSEEATSNTVRLAMLVDGQKIKTQEIGWDASDRAAFVAEARLAAGEHVIALETAPGDPPREGENRLNLSVRKFELQGPLEGGPREYPPEFRRVFSAGPPPADPARQREYARAILRHFADRAFRRPVDERTLERLVAMAMDSPGGARVTFEQRIAQALTAVLASPRFLYRAEIQAEPDAPGRIVPLDEYALASRLSYFLWSSLPDDELFRLAGEKRLRSQLKQQVERMLSDPKSNRFVENFVGQWLQTRDVETLNVDARRILGVKSTDQANRVFSRVVRRAMREETELLFGHLLRENASALDLLTADYTFVNEPLAKFYDLPEVDGNQMRKVSLSADSHRGGILSHGSFLIVTSNPARTSPVKRGLFVLENLLGTPTPPPPPNVPQLDDARKRKGKKLTMRQIMEAHRRDPLCSSCHARMDPLGLALEDYNALGVWRDREDGKPIVTAGQLITGEKFAGARELAQVIATQRRTDYYRCLAEKMLTYAIGRGVDYHDAPAIDRLVDSMNRDGGKMQSLILELVSSAPFQMRRGDGNAKQRVP